MNIDLASPELEQTSRRGDETARQLAGLNAAAIAVNSAKSVDAVLQIICDQARDIIGAHQAVSSLNLNQNWAQAINALSLSEKYAAFLDYDALPDGTGIYTVVCELNRPFRMTQAQLEAHPRWRGFGKDAAIHPPMRGWLAAPLKNRTGANIGLIQLSDKFEGEFTEHDESLLLQLSQLGSVAIEIRRAHDELEKRVTQRTAELEHSNAELKREITERKRADEALLASETKWRQLAQTCPDSILTLNLDGTIAFINHSTPGYPAVDEIIGTSIYQWLPAEQRGPFRQTVAHVIATGEIASYELASVRPDGLQSWWATRMAPVMLHGNVQAITVVSSEITMRKNAEEAVRRLNAQLEERVAERTAQLQAANKELEAFCYSVSHDLRTPLRAIDGFSQAILEDCPDALNETARSHFKRIRDASQRMSQLIDDLLRLSRLTRSEMRREPVDLSALAHAVAFDLQHADPKRRVTLNIAEDLLGIGDPVLLRLVLQNLLGNAWKFTSKRAQARIDFGKTNKDGKSVYFVRDDGVGFDMEYASKLFGVFQRLHSSKDFPGTGIGLAIVQRILHRHDGAIWVEAAVDQGTTFYFTLPEPSCP